MSRNEKPDYKKIYSDIIEMKYPLKKEQCKKLLSKETLSTFDLIMINQIIFGDSTENHKHRSYDKKTIVEILDFQKKNNLNNTQLANHFKLSRNTVTKWKKTYLL